MFKDLLKDTINKEDYNSIDCEELIGISAHADNTIINGTFSMATPYLAETYGTKLVADLSKLISDYGIGESIVGKKWAEIKLNEPFIHNYMESPIAGVLGMDEWRLQETINKQIMRFDSQTNHIDVSKSNKKLVEAGIIREGFARVAKLPFLIDTVALRANLEFAKEITLKGLNKQIDSGAIKSEYLLDPANQVSVVDGVFDIYLTPAKEYNSEYNISDPRGRAIYNVTKRLGNYIANKAMRSLIMIPVEHRETVRTIEKGISMKSIYYAIGNMVGSKATTEKRIIQSGKLFYKNRKQAHDTAENIWINRIYKELDRLYASPTKSIDWSVPLEADERASLNQYAAVLLGDERMLKRVSLIGDEVKEAWEVEGLDKPKLKACYTPWAYGSSASAKSLLDGKEVNHTTEDIARLNSVKTDSEFGSVIKLKDALIKGGNITTPEFEAHIWNEKIAIAVNKFKHIGSTIECTIAWNTKSKKMKPAFTHKPQYEPDYSRFKLFLATLLIHNLDSQVMDQLAELDYWMLTIHDAVIAGPKAVWHIRNKYVEIMEDMYNDRKSILLNYRKSIGATSFKGDILMMKVMESIVPVNNPDHIVWNRCAMK